MIRYSCCSFVEHLLYGGRRCNENIRTDFRLVSIVYTVYAQLSCRSVTIAEQAKEKLLHMWKNRWNNIALVCAYLRKFFGLQFRIFFCCCFVSLCSLFSFPFFNMCVRIWRQWSKDADRRKSKQEDYKPKDFFFSGSIFSHRGTLISIHCRFVVVIMLFQT